MILAFQVKFTWSANITEYHGMHGLLHGEMSFMEVVFLKPVSLWIVEEDSSTSSAYLSEPLQITQSEFPLRKKDDPCVKSVVHRA